MSSLHFNDILDKVEKLYNKNITKSDFFKEFPRSSFSFISFDFSQINKNDDNHILFYLEIIRILLLNNGNLEVIFNSKNFIKSTSFTYLSSFKPGIHNNILLYINDKDFKDVFKKLNKLFIIYEEIKYHTDIRFKNVEKDFGNKTKLYLKPIFSLKPENETINFS